MTVRMWHRNVIGAVVTTVALALFIVFIGEPAWDRYQRTVTPAHIAAPGQPVTVDGQTWAARNISRSTRRPGSDAELPQGTVLFNVTVERSGPEVDGFSCAGFLVAGDRSWRASLQPCGATTTRWSFLIPADTEPTAVDIRDLGGSILIRLQL